MDSSERLDEFHAGETSFKEDADISEQLITRYSASSAPQHRHLIATAAAIRSLLQEDSCTLAPSAYFASAIENLSGNLEALDSTAVAALLSLVSIVTPLIPENGINEGSARKAVSALVKVVGVENAVSNLGMGTVRGVVKCLGILIVTFIHLESWDSVKDGIEALINFSLDKRHKVRRTGQECLENVFKLIKLSTIRKEASELVMSFVSRCERLAVSLSLIRVKDASEESTLSKPEHLEILYWLNLLKIVVPYLSTKISSRILILLIKLKRPQFSALSRHVLRVFGAIFEASKSKVICSHVGEIVDCFRSFLSVLDNPADTMISTLVLLRLALAKLVIHGQNLLMERFSNICSCVTALLSCKDVASAASETMIELINKYLNVKTLTFRSITSPGDACIKTEEGIVESVCTTLQQALISCEGILNKHLLQVISAMFLKLRENSCIYMKMILLQLVELRKYNKSEALEMDDLDRCIGSAIVVMGPRPIIEYFPIAFCSDDCSCGNFWLIPILKKYVVGASLKYYVEYFVPLAKSLQKVCRKGKRNAIGKDLQDHARDICSLLCSFCRYPTDTHKEIEPLADVLIRFVRKGSYWDQYISAAFETLINQNRCILEPAKYAGENMDSSSSLEWESTFSYSMEIASKNMRALVSCSPKLLQALAELYVVSSLEKRFYIKGAIESLASITDSTVRRNIILSLCERFNVPAGKGKEVENDSNIGMDLGGKEEDVKLNDDNGKTLENLNIQPRDDKRHAVLDLTSLFVKGANSDLVDLMYGIVANIIQANDMSCHAEAYNTLSKILEEHTLFCSARISELINFVMGVIRPGELESLKNRCLCLRILMIYLLKINSEDGEKMAFLILNELILTLKEKSDNMRKLSYDSLLWISSQLKDRSTVDSDAPRCKLVFMILAYLSTSTPHMKSGAVSALSVLVYDDVDICAQVSDLVPTLVSLLENKSVELVKAVLGFMKVLASCMQVNRLQSSLPEILNGLLPWSAISRHHFRSKVTVIVEILARKCGSSAVEKVTPNRYKTFLKAVLKNRQKKAASVEDVTSRLGNQQPSSLARESGTIQRKRKWSKTNDTSRGLGKQLKSAAGGVLEKGPKRAKYGTFGEGMKGQSRNGGRKKDFSKNATQKRRKERPKKVKKDDVSKVTRSKFPRKISTKNR